METKLEKFEIEKSLLKERRLYDDNLMDKSELEHLIRRLTEGLQAITYNIPGYITHDDFIGIIEDEFIIKQNDYLGKVKMDASNYYIQAGDFRPIKKLKIL